MMTVGTIEPLPDAFGATVFGIDCGSLDDATALREAWRKYRVLIFRDVVKSDDDLGTLGRCFGDLLPSRFSSPLASRSEVMVISNVLVDGEPAGGFPDGEIEWHYDGMH